MARAASELSPTMRTTRPQRVLRKAQARKKASAMPMRNSGFTCSADCSCGSELQSPKEIEGRLGAFGWMNGLPRKKARPVPAFDLLRRLERSEEHTSELQSPDHLVCRLLLGKKKQT